MTSSCNACGKDIVDVKPRKYCSRSCAGRKNGTGVFFRPSAGRWFVGCRDGSSVLYSRALMCGHLGRMLAYNEVVHHINGDPTDDRLENLELVSRQEHGSLHQLDIRRSARSRRNVKLTMEDARRIRQMEGTNAAIARVFDVAPSLISQVQNHRIWREDDQPVRSAA
jgi:hypothetical protein